MQKLTAPLRDKAHAMSLVLQGSEFRHQSKQAIQGFENEMAEINEEIARIEEEEHNIELQNNVNQIIWHDGNPTNITNEQILEKQSELQAEYDAQDYARKREAEYPTIQEAVHAILDDDLENLQVLRQAVKDKYPKND